MYLILKQINKDEWWKADTPDEIIIGAILTQQTQWSNVEKAMRNLKREGMLSISRLADANLQSIERAIRPTGFYRQKATRLKEASERIMDNGGVKRVFSLPQKELYDILISLKGVGMETADSIALYGADKPTFVVDNYTWRVISRVYGREEPYDYGKIKEWVEGVTTRNAELYKEMHSYFVELGKSVCVKRDPICAQCPISRICSYGKANGSHSR